MNFEQVQNRGQQQYYLRPGEVTLEKLDTFINRVIKERGYNLQILGQDIQNGLQSGGMRNIIEDEVYTHILQRIIKRLETGES